MADIACPKCGEPWGIDSLHEETEDRLNSGVSMEGASYEEAFRQVKREFMEEGCDALAGAFGPSDCAQQARNSFRAQAASALYDVMGDDLDGVAAMLDDAGL